MRLSQLQKYILLRGLEHRQATVDKEQLLKYYLHHRPEPKPADQVKIITKSVERLIDKGLVKSTGIKTKDKWYIKQVILTRLGKQEAKKLLGQQALLPFKHKL